VMTPGLWGADVVYYGKSWDFVCRTENYSEIAALKALIGAAYTLNICSDTCTAVITSFREREITPILWEYEIEFARDDSGF
jgi:hypothetical protein